ncbi:hypothetical protein H4582DRAFT_1126528 [Lactarius indigo]|nr:hypothetical protein H4582DRAFT_1126528 [Lactarius indigo]
MCFFFFLKVVSTLVMKTQAKPTSHPKRGGGASASTAPFTDVLAWSRSFLRPLPCRKQASPSGGSSGEEARVCAKLRCDCDGASRALQTEDGDGGRRDNDRTEK